MDNINSTQYEEIKAILEKENPNDFNIQKFIEDVGKVKEKTQKPKWSHDEWDNWYGGY